MEEHRNPRRSRRLAYQRARLQQGLLMSVLLLGTVRGLPVAVVSSVVIVGVLILLAYCLAGVLFKAALTVLLCLCSQVVNIVCVLLLNVGVCNGQTI